MLSTPLFTATCQNHQNLPHLWLNLFNCQTVSQPLRQRYTVNTIGITQFGKYLSCLQCNQKIADGWFAFNILKCHYCSLTQKRKNAKKSDASKLKSHMMIVSFITFFHQEILDISNGGCSRSRTKLSKTMMFCLLSITIYCLRATILVSVVVLLCHL